MGGSFSLISSTLSDLNSFHMSNGAIYGGAIYCDKCTLTLNTVTFSTNFGN
jgi:hypothetical protein